MTQVDLVAIEFLCWSPPYNAGEVAAFDPTRALELVRSGAARLVENAVTDAAGGDGFVDIPDDWAGLHWTKKVQLAKAILGGEGDLTGDEAKVIITEELARRAELAAQTPAVDQAEQPVDDQPVENETDEAAAAETTAES